MPALTDGQLAEYDRDGFCIARRLGEGGGPRHQRRRDQAVRRRGDVAWLDPARAMKARKAELQNARTSNPGTS